MKDLLGKIKLENADYRKIKERFEEFMFEATSGIEDSMIKQIPEFAELTQTRDIIVNRIENVVDGSHFDMFQEYQHTMDKMRLLEIETYFCLGMKFAKEL